MKARWPMKQTMAIRWSAAAWRPTIRFTSISEGQRQVVRIVRTAFVNEGNADLGSGI
jgi:hypothetical protein